MRKLTYDPQAAASALIGDCSILYLAKEGHEGGAVLSWLTEQKDKSIVDLGMNSQLIISYDSDTVVSVHTGGAWGLTGKLRQPGKVDPNRTISFASSLHKDCFHSQQNLSWIILPMSSTSRVNNVHHSSA